MSFEGTIVNGNVVLDEPSSLPEGTRVNVQPRNRAEPEERSESLSSLLLSFAGQAQGLPEDAAAQHDHYLYGTPKR